MFLPSIPPKYIFLACWSNDKILVCPVISRVVKACNSVFHAGWRETRLERSVWPKPIIPLTPLYDTEAGKTMELGIRVLGDQTLRDKRKDMEPAQQHTNKTTKTASKQT